MESVLNLQKKLGMHRVVPVFDTLDDALAAFRA